MTLGQRGRRFAAAPAVTWKRVRARPGRTLLVSVGVAVAVGFLIGAAGGSTVSEELALRHALTALPPAERVVRVTWSGQVATGGYGALDRTARRQLTRVTGEPVDAAVELADVRLGHGLVKLGASDSLGGVVHVTSGRLPTGCTPARCEVIELAGLPLRRIDDAGVHLVVVGRGTLSSLVPFGEEGLQTPPAVGGRPPEAVLVTKGVRGLVGLGPLALFNRNYSWSAALAPAAVHGWSIDSLLRTEGLVQQRLTVASPLYSLTTPDDALTAAKSQSETASRRVLLVGSSAALLLLAFAGITAGALRRDAQAELRRLTMRGATRPQQASFVFGEAVAAVIPGALAGLGVGAVAVALIAHRAGVPVGGVLGHGLLTPTAVALAAGGTIGAVVAVVFALRAVDGRRPRGVRPVDMAAVGAAVALALLLIRGQGSAGSLGSGPAVALAATPLLAGFAFCVLLGRLLEPALRVALRSARSGPSTLLIALLTLHRSPGRTAGLAGFLAVSAGLAMFALSYRSTLAASSNERAAYQVPLDYTLSIGPSLDSPQDVASLARYRALSPGLGAWPVLRQTAEVAGSGTRPATPTVLGVPAAAFPLIHGWRSDFSSDGPAALGRLLQPPKPVALTGAVIPETASRLELPAVLNGPEIQPVLVVQTRSGEADELRPQLATGGAQLLTAAVPPADRGGKIVALRLDLPSAVQRSSAHQQAEGHNGAQAFGGTLRLKQLVAVTGSGRVPVTSFRGWDGQGGITATHNAAGVRTDFAIDTSETALLRPRQPFDSRMLPVIASPDIARAAGPDGELQLVFGADAVAARLVAVARRFPTTEDVGDSFVVADESSLAAALGANDLPTSIPDELWLSTPPALSAHVGAELARPPFATLQVDSRSAIASGYRAEPLARGIVVSLIAAAVAAVGLALAGLVLVTVGFVRDEGDTLYDLETQGVGPRALRASVRWRALGVTALGLAAGILLGAVMVAVTERLLALDATLTLPDPPLRRVIPWLTLGAAAAVFALLASALVEVVLRVSQRASAAGRGTTGESWA